MPIKDHKFFDIIDTEEKAYWLGFICADGYIHKNFIGIDINRGNYHTYFHLSKRNWDLLDSIAKELGVSSNYILYRLVYESWKEGEKFNKISIAKRRDFMVI